MPNRVARVVARKKLVLVWCWFRRGIPFLAMSLFVVAQAAVGEVDEMFVPVVNGEGVACAIPGEGDTLLVGGTLRSSVSDWSSSGVVKLKRDGRVDTSFSANVGPSSAGVLAIVALPDRKLLIGGDFQAVDGIPRKHIARLLENGRLDPAFDAGPWNIPEGIEVSPFRLGVNRLRVEADGGILLGNVDDIFNAGTSRPLPYDWVVRMFNDGRLDAGYNPAAEPRPFARRQSDGGELYREVEIGYSGTLLRRFFPDLKPDPAFVRVIPGSVPYTTFTAVTLLPDDRILVAIDKIRPVFGSPPWFDFLGYSFEGFELKLLRRDGQDDPGFPVLTQARPVYNFNPFVPPSSYQKPVVHGLFPLPGGDFVVAGNFDQIGGRARPGLARIQGVPVIPAPVLVALPLVPKDVVALLGEPVAFESSGFSQAGPVRYQWRHNGVELPGATNRFFSSASARAAEAGDYEVTATVTGLAPARAKANLRVLLRPAGSVDPGFNAGIEADGAILALALQPDGKILIGGQFARINGRSRPGIARLQADGNLDDSFDPGSGFHYATLPGQTAARVLLAQPDGKIMVGGRFTEYQGRPVTNLARLLPGGGLDQGFVLDPPPANELTVLSLALQSGGRLLVSGAFSYFGSQAGDYFNPQPQAVPYASLARFDSSGRLDRSLQFGYMSWFSCGAACKSFSPNTIFRVRVLPDDGIVIAGNIPGGIRFFDHQGGGPQGLAIPGTDASKTEGVPSVDRLEVQPDGTLYFGGTFYLRDGSGYLSAGPVGKWSGHYDREWDSRVQVERANFMTPLFALNKHDQIVVSGIFPGLNGGSNTLARFQPDGSPDPLFKLRAGPDKDINALVVQPDGKILVAGDFTTIDGVPRQGLARLHGDPIEITATGDPLLRGVMKTGDQFGVSISTITGAGYVLEYAEQLPATAWHRVAEAAGDGSVKRFTLSVPGIPRRFYRVRIE